MIDRESTRRDVLRAVAGAGAGLVAGCTALDDGPGDPLGPATDLELLPAPSAFGDGEQGYGFRKFDVTALLDAREQFPPESISRFVFDVEYSDHVEDVRDLDAFVGVSGHLGSGFGIQSGSFDVDRIGDSLTDDEPELEHVDTYGEAEIYAGVAPFFGAVFASAIAVEPDAVTTFSLGPETETTNPPAVALLKGRTVDVPAAVAGVTTILAARRGAAERYVETSDAIATLVGTLSADPTFNAGPWTPDAEHFSFPPITESWAEPVVANGQATGLEGSTAVKQWAFVGPADDPLPVELLRQAVREYDRPVPGFEDVTVDSRDRAVAVEGRMPVSGVKLDTDLESLEFAHPPPDVSFAFDWRPSDGAVRIEHAGGEPIAPDNTGIVTVTSGEDVREGWFNRFADDPDPVEPGDAISVPAAPGDAVTVDWVSFNQTLRRTLAEFTVPE